MISLTFSSPEEAIVPPPVARVKNCSSLTSFASVVWDTKTTSTEEYLWFKNWYKRKKKLRAKNFLDLVIDPETSITKLISAELRQIGRAHV